MSSVSHQTDAGRPGEPHIGTHAVNLLICCLEASLQGSSHFLVTWVGRKVMPLKVTFQISFNVVRKSVFQQRTHFSTIGSMPVGNGEEMAMTETHNMGVCHICILVNLVGVVSCDASLSRKGELSDDVHNFAMRGRLARLILFSGGSFLIRFRRRVVFRLRASSFFPRFSLRRFGRLLAILS